MAWLKDGTSTISMVRVMNNTIGRQSLPLLMVLAALSAVGAGSAVAPSDASAATRKVPAGFIGVDLDPWRTSALGLNLASELKVAASSGVETVRFPVYWSSIQTGPHTYIWKHLDSFVGEAAKRNIALIPTVMDAPTWTADRRYSWAKTNTKLMIPNNFGRYANFVATLAKRYGTRGSYWAANTSLRKKPITTWQVWNEPDLPYYWPSHAGERQTVTVNGHRKSSRSLLWAPSYVRLVQATRSALRRADRSAKLMLGSTTNRSWRSLHLVYLSGGRGSFDYVGVNIFTSSVGQLKTALGYVKREMDSNRDRTSKIVATEVSWLAAQGKLRKGTNMSWIVTTPAGQAKQVKAALLMLSDRKFRASGRIAGAYWYSWISSYTGNRLPWNYSGLRQYSPVRGTALSRPSLSAFSSTARSLEGR